MNDFEFAQAIPQPELTTPIVSVKHPCAGIGTRGSGFVTAPIAHHVRSAPSAPSALKDSRRYRFFMAF
jgi:hypothetical protein